MALALRLGMTLQDLRERMSAEELLLWMAYDQGSPISDSRGDILAAVTAAAAFQAQGAKVSALDLIPKWKPEAVTPLDEEQEAEQGEELFRTFLMAKSESAI
ncbi:DUF4035 domain-containing protein [Pseudomonas rhodesiae]|nr:DUF4035 domain-containing protein [Pseudomonas rhodesiae]ROM61004.1 hypothetical protein BK650_05790 [Pseudomonas rhodesiae]ROM68576.1 hypothetical protein BK651_00250 [Pseudomonas rhodesiae]